MKPHVKYTFNKDYLLFNMRKHNPNKEANLKL